MKWILQSEDDTELGIEYHIVKEILTSKRMKYVNSFEEVTTEQIVGDKYKYYIPIGDLLFVRKWLKETAGIDRIVPIEVPKYLQKDEFLHRYYSIRYWKDIPDSRSWFIKDVTELKEFAQVLDFSRSEDICIRDELNRNHKYLVSSLSDIKSEWRAYVIDGEVENICNYNGDTLVYPSANLIQRVVNMIRANEKWLKSFTIDIMVGYYGTSLIEIHDFVSVGLYGSLWGDNLLTAYRQGIEYLLNDNGEKP